MHISGTFVRPDLDWIRPLPTEVEWQQATVNLGVSDPRGLTQRTSIRWGTQDLPLVGGVAPVGLFTTGVRATVPGLGNTARGSEISFACTIQLNGTRE